jgi:phosphohistidine phosphatase
MHRLHLLRHAKSNRDEGVEDKERPLARRGRDASRRIGETLPAGIGAIDLVLCSSSLRTRETAALVLAKFKPKPKILFEDGLYLAGPKALLRRLMQLEEGVGSVLVIGHNPGLHELAIALAASDSASHRDLAAGKFPTGARASFLIEVPWGSLDKSRHRLTDYVTPKSLGEEDR